MKILSLSLGSFQTNCYIIFDENTKACCVIDPGFEPDKIIKCIKENQLKPYYILLTHGHGDHIGAVPQLKEAYPEAKVMIGANDQYRLANPHLSLLSMMGSQAVMTADQTLKDGDIIQIDSISIKVLDTPGHTEGGISLLGSGVVFVGDTLFQGDVGRTDLPGGDGKKLVKSIQQKLYVLPDDTVVYPGHGPATSIGEEKRFNAYVREM